MPNQLRQWRMEHHLTQDEVAALTGYTAATISRLENGDRHLRPLDKVRFARLLGVPLRVLFEVPKTMGEDGEPEEVPMAG